MSPNALGSLKLLLAFAFATVSSLLIAQGLHSAGWLRPASPVVPLVAAVGVRQEPVAQSRAEVKVLPKAIPVPESPVQLARLAPDKITAASLLTPLQRPGQEPFDAMLRENLRTDLPKALPLPMVYQAVLMADDEFLRGLLLSGFLPDEMAPDGDTALCAAVRAGRESSMRLLLGSGAAVDKTGREGQPPLVLASLKRGSRLLEILLNAGANPDTRFNSPVDEDLVKSIAFDDLRHHLRSDRGVTVLMACAARGDVEAAVCLMKHSASTELHTRRLNRYALDFAAEQHYLFLMRVLLGRPPDKEPDLRVTVDLSKQRAWIEKGGKVVDSTVISSGRDGYETPPGDYVVTDKHKEWTSTLYKASMPWFMRLNCSAVGLHAGYVTGHPASHGCVRLPPEKAQEWFKIVGVGDEVRIVE